MSFRDEEEDDEDESFWTSSSGSCSNSKGSSKSKGSSWFSGSNSRSDYQKGREDAWRDSYIFGDSYKYDSGRTGGSSSYRDGYNAGYEEGED